MFGMGETDEYPKWALPLLSKRMLWRDYGIAFEEITFEEVMLAISLQNLEAERERYQIEKIKRQHND